jgi:hypothetical protein
MCSDHRIGKGNRMAAERRVIHIRAGSELAEALRDATEAREPLFVHTGDDVFEIHVDSTDSVEIFNRDRRFSVLDIAGLGASGMTGSIADHMADWETYGVRPSSDWGG